MEQKREKREKEIFCFPISSLILTLLYENCIESIRASMQIVREQWLKRFLRSFSRCNVKFLMNA